MRQWKKRKDKKKLSIDASYPEYNYFYDDNGDLIDIDYDLSGYLNFQPGFSHQYSFVGPLSMQKGCDRAFHMYTKVISSAKNTPRNNGVGYQTNKLSYRGSYTIYKICFFMDNLQNQYISGENPLVVTDARCFMPWIASQYNMKLEKDYKPRDNCQKGNGNRDNVDQKRC